MLLKGVFEYAFDNGFDGIYVTVFEKYVRLIDMLQDFGFQKSDDKTSLGELILAKSLQPVTAGYTPEDALEYHIRYGPRKFRTDVSWYVVPIQPQYSNILFPETAQQASLFPGSNAFGNSIRKAYLSNSPMRSIPQGSVLVFYRSHRNTGAIVVGVVEDTMVSSSAKIIARTVGKRTVYNLTQIEQLCQKPVLAILFRQARVLKPAITRAELIGGEVFTRVPQSIIRVKEEGQTWLRNKITR